MDTKVFARLYLDNEYDIDILAATYIIVSQRVRKSTRWSDSVITYTKQLFPHPDLLYNYSLEDEEFSLLYIKQLKKNIGVLASAVKCAIEYDMNIIFLATKNENKKFGHLKMIGDLIYSEFGYPVYDYELFVYGCEIEPFDEVKCLKKANKVLKQVNKDNVNKLHEEHNEAALMKYYGNLSKKKLKKILLKEDLYIPHMSKAEMLESIEMFLI